MLFIPCDTLPEKPAIDTCIVWAIPVKVKEDNDPSYEAYIVKKCDGTFAMSKDARYEKYVNKKGAITK